MSYIYNNEIKLADSAHFDAFSRLRTSQITTLLDIKHLYDKLPYLVDEVLNGTATSEWDNSMVNMSVSQNGDYVIRQTIKSANYQSGKSQLFEASFSNFQIETGVIKRIGYYNSNTTVPYDSNFDGIFLESNGVTNEISFQIWNSGTLILNSNLNSWLKDEYDATTIDWSKSQLMMIDFQWLGVGRVRFYMIDGGTPKLFITHTGTNNLNYVYMKSPNKPIRYEIRSNSGTGSLVSICSGVSMEGAINSLTGHLGLENFTERTLTTIGVTYPLMGLRLGMMNRGSSGRLTDTTVLQTSNDNYLITLQINPVLSGTASWISMTNTPIESSKGDGTLTVTTPGQIIFTSIGSAATLGNDVYNFMDSIYSLGHKINGIPDEWWICVTPVSSNAKFRLTCNVEFSR